MSTLEKYLDSGIEEVKTVKESAKNIVNEAMRDLRSLLMNPLSKNIGDAWLLCSCSRPQNRLNQTGLFEAS
jgi:hypothetical protein